MTDELEKHRQAVLKTVDNFLSDVDHKQILDTFSMFVDTLHECLRCAEPREFAALQHSFDSLGDAIIDDT